MADGKRGADLTPGAGSAGLEARIRLLKDAYDEGKRLVDNQQAELESVRQRSIQFVAFVGAATAFLLNVALANRDRSLGFFVIAITASVLIAVMIIALSGILFGVVVNKGVHRMNWRFRFDPRTLVEKWIEPDVGAQSEDSYYRKLAVIYGRNAQLNEGALRQLRRVYLALVLCGVGQIVAWACLVWLYG